MVNDGLKCNHELDLEGTTLIQLNRRTMVSPAVIDYFCPCCKKFFKYGLNKDNNYVLIKPED